MPLNDISLVLWLMSALSFGCLALLAVVVFAFLKMLRDMFGQARLTSERNELQRDRLLGQFMEYKQTQDADDRTQFQIANLHAGEHREAVGANLHRDGKDSPTEQERLRANTIKNDRLAELDVPGSEQDAM